jgi:hypothetical protein
MTAITANRLYDAPADVVWAVMTDPEVYAAVAPNLSSVSILDDGGDGNDEGDRKGVGEGMVRRCVDTYGNAWTESCHYWEPGRGFGIAVDIETSDFHRPWFTRFEGHWELTERDDGVVVTIQFDFQPKYGPLGALVARYLRYRSIPLIEAIFDGWRAEIESRLADGAPSGAAAVADAGPHATGRRR